MAIPLIVNGVTFQYPQQFDLNWGPTLTNWSSAVTTGMLQKAGGSFPLTAEVDFGGSFGIKVLSLKSQESNVATTGILRLGNASAGIVWRNASNSANLPLTVNASNQLTFNGVSIGATTSLTNSHILVGNVSNQPADVAMSGDLTIANTGVTTINPNLTLTTLTSAGSNPASSGFIRMPNSVGPAWRNVANSANLVLAANGANQLEFGGFGIPIINGTFTANTVAIWTAASTLGYPGLANSATTATELGYVSGVTSAIQTQLNSKLALSGGTMAGTLNMGSNKIVSLTQGSNAGEAISFPVSTSQISSSAVTTALIAANAVTQTNTGTTSVTLTTTGGPVLIFGQMDRSLTTVTGALGFVGYDSTFNIVRDGVTTIYTQRQANGGLVTGKAVIATFSGSVIDTPSAASHTYTITFTGGVGTDNGNVNTSMNAVEFKR